MAVQNPPDTSSYQAQVVNLQMQSTLTHSSLVTWRDEPNLHPLEQSARQAVMTLIASVGTPYVDFDSFLSTPLRIEGDLDLTSIADRTALTNLPRGLSVGGTLNLSKCSSLVQMPQDLMVGGSLILAGCEDLQALPARLMIEGDLDINGCINLISLPDNLVVRGSLDAADCDRLLQISRHLVVGGNLRLSDCENLVDVPSGIRIGGSFLADGCVSLERIDGPIQVGFDMDLTDCASLRRLPDILRVEGDLNLCGCGSLMQLSRTLNVQGHLDLSDCVNLQALPDGLVVGGDLEMGHCEQLTALPNHLFVGGNINLFGCTRITGLPQDMTQWGPGRDGRVRRIELANSGVTQAVLQRLADSDNEPAAGIQFFYGMTARMQEGLIFENAQTAIAYWFNLQKSSWVPQTSTWEMDAAANQTLAQFLGRLCGTSDYEHIHARAHLVERCCNLLTALDADSLLRHQIIDILEQSLTTCGDRITLAMNQAELAVAVYHAENGAHGHQELMQLLIKFMQLEIVHAHARHRAANLRFVDEVEVFLAYEIGLRERLALPLGTRTMLFARCADVSQHDLERAGLEAEHAARDTARVNAYLADSAPWQRHLRKEEAAGWSYRALPLDPASEFPNLEQQHCPLTLEPFLALTEPLMWRHGQSCVVYEAAAILRHWVMTGNEPTTRRPLSLKDLRRPRS